MASNAFYIVLAWTGLCGASLVPGRADGGDFGTVAAQAQLPAVISVARELQQDDPQDQSGVPSVLTLSSGPPVALAQAPTGAEIRGTVTDAQGRPRPNVLVELRDAGGALRSTQADASGAFVFSDLAPGTYRVSAKFEGAETGGTTVGVAAGESKSVTLGANNASEEVHIAEVVVVSQRYDQARNALSPSTGNSQFVFDQEDIVALPRGVYTPMNQIMLQVPGVVQGDYGELHTRGEMTQPQYRINGIIIPEGIAGFGQLFDPRFAERIEFLTGALPAEYNYRTNVIDIQTKQRFDNGGKVSLYGGSYATLSPSVELSGSKDKFTYYLTGTYYQSENGILFPTSDYYAIHDNTTQANGFAYAAFLPDSTSKLSLILGATQAQFQIPNVPGQTPTYPLDGVSFFPDLPSADLNENQRELNRYAVISYQGMSGASLNYQAAFLTHYSSVQYSPDPIGDLIYRGIAPTVQRTNTTYGVQFDASWDRWQRHTVGFGFSANSQRTDSDNTSQVFPADSNGQQIPGGPFTVVDTTSLTTKTAGVYAQDSWRATESLTINYGLRFDYFDGLTRSGQLSPRLGVVYNWDARTTLHAAYASYFNPPRPEFVGPDTIAKFANTTAQPQVQESSPVVPERMRYFDAGMTRRLSPDLNLGLDAYAKYAQDLNDYGQFGQALVYSPFNWTQARIYGIEFTAQYRKGSLSAYFNAAVSWAQGQGISSGQFNFSQEELDYINSHWVYLDHDQRLTSSAGISYQWREIRFLADAIFGSGMRSTPEGGTPNSDHLPAYLQVNVGIGRDFPTRLGKIEVRFSIVNLFDSVYEIRDGTGVGVGAPQFGPRRSFYGAIAATF